MEFEKNDASASAKLRKRKRAKARKNRRLLEKRSRQLMEQSAPLKHDIDTVKTFAPLCPVVWSMLPEELLQRVFSRLPLPEIIRLRVLSKTWDRYVTGVTPGFTKLCAEQNPNLFALINEGSEDGIDNMPDNGPMVIKLYDSKGNSWHEFVHKTCDSGFAGNGGLLCVVSTAPDRDMEIRVFNPLTKQERELPSSSSLSRVRLRMVQLVMDRDSKCYKVLVVGSKREGGDDAVARIFSSMTGEWSKPNIFSDFIFDSLYFGNEDRGLGEKPDPRAYDCASSTLLDLFDDSYPSKLWDKGVLVKDRLFILRLNYNHKYVLMEYQARSCQPRWVQVKVHKCYELDAVCRYQRHVKLKTQLWGCPDFLVVNACGGCDDFYAHKQTWLFDLSTSKWKIIPEIPEWWPTDAPGQLFELQWDAVA